MVNKIFFIFLFFFGYTILAIICDETIIDLNSYKHPLPEDDDSELYTIAIVGTNDVHGAAFPKTLINPQTKQQYSYGGLEYMS